MRAPTVLRLGAATTLVASALVVGATAPSQAASCVTYDLSQNRRAVVVENTCDEARRVKVYWTRATDSACTTLAAHGGRLIDSRGYPADFDRIEGC